MCRIHLHSTCCIENCSKLLVINFKHISNLTEFNSENIFVCFIGLQEKVLFKLYKLLTDLQTCYKFVSLINFTIYILLRYEHLNYHFNISLCICIFILPGQTTDEKSYQLSCILNSTSYNLREPVEYFGYLALF